MTPITLLCDERQGATLGTESVSERQVNMAHDEKRGLLETLKAELRFLKDGGYWRPFRNDWRAQFTFEDSPTYLNCNASAKHLVPCSNCVPMSLIPVELRSVKWPCRQIPLNRAGETLDSLYRYADPSEVEITVRRWLEAQIQQLENKEAAATEEAHEETSNGPATDEDQQHCARLGNSHDWAFRIR